MVDKNIFLRTGVTTMVAMSSAPQDKAINVLKAQCPSRNIVTANGTQPNNGQSSYYNDALAKILYTSNLIADLRNDKTQTAFMQNGIHSGMADKDICNGVIAGSATTRVGGTHGTQDNTVLDKSVLNTPIKLTDFGTEDIAYLVNFGCAKLDIVDKHLEDPHFGKEHHLFADNNHIATIYPDCFTPIIGKHIINTDDNCKDTTHPTDAPVSHPTDKPVSHRTDKPVSHPTDAPVSHRTHAPVSHRTHAPVSHRTHAPVSHRTHAPVSHPTDKPVSYPTDAPVSHPTDKPVSHPTDAPVSHPTDKPVSHRTDKPVSHPTDKPVSHPTDAPVSHPTDKPVSHPTDNDNFLPKECKNIQTVKPSDYPNKHTVLEDNTYFYQDKAQKKAFSGNLIVDTRNSTIKHMSFVNDHLEKSECNAVIIDKNIKKVVCSETSQDNIIIKKGKNNNHLHIYTFGHNDIVHLEGFNEKKLTLKENKNTHYYDLKEGKNKIATLRQQYFTPSMQNINVLN